MSDAVDTGLHIIAGADQSEASLRRRLKIRGYETDVVDDAIARLREYGYVNDQRLAEGIAARKLRTGYGRSRVAADLRGRGIDDDVVNNVMVGLKAEDETEACVQAAEKWINSHGQPTDGPAKRKISAALQRRGFSFDAIQRVLREEPSRST